VQWPFALFFIQKLFPCRANPVGNKGKGTEKRFPNRIRQQPTSKRKKDKK
jgi:hypothetical protein